MNKMIFLVAIALLAPQSQAAPIPGATTIRPALGVLKSPVGFEISAATTSWKLDSIPKSNSFIVGVFTPAQKSNASLTLRVDKMVKEASLQSYVQRWQKEYPKYGFDILGSKSFEQNGMTGYAVDILQRDTQKEIRQVVFMKDKKAIVMTCKDQTETFRNTLKDCNQIIRTFKWE